MPLECRRACSRLPPQSGAGKRDSIVSGTENNVFLVGPMGSGKTTIGKRLARLLQLEFQDCDEELEKQTGASVSLIFDVEGEQGFRERESVMLATLADKKNVLVATGGGVVMRAQNRALLRRSGLVVYLSTPVERQLARLDRDHSRPLLQTADKKQRLLQLAEKRNPLYEEVADIIYPSKEKSVRYVARKLAALINDHRSDGSPELNHAPG
jgi:shikimate kinase